MLIRSDEPRAEKTKNRSRLRVLIVEDHRETAQAVSRILDHDGFDARFVGSYKEALQAASERIPDLLVCDIGLPGKDGLDVMKTMRKAYPGLKGLVISAHAAPEDVQRSLAAGFAEHLAKPISAEALVHAIHRVVDASTHPPRRNPAGE